MAEVGEGAGLDVLESALAEVQVLERRVRGHVGTRHGRPAEEVPVEVELEAVGGHSGRDRGEAAPRAVDDVARRVAEARPGTLRRRSSAAAVVRVRLSSAASPFRCDVIDQ